MALFSDVLFLIFFQRISGRFWESEQTALSGVWFALTPRRTNKNNGFWWVPPKLLTIPLSLTHPLPLFHINQNKYILVDIDITVKTCLHHTAIVQLGHIGFWHPAYWSTGYSLFMSCLDRHVLIQLVVHHSLLMQLLITAKNNYFSVLESLYCMHMQWICDMLTVQPFQLS